MTPVCGIWTRLHVNTRWRPSYQALCQLLSSFSLSFDAVSRWPTSHRSRESWPHGGRAGCGPSVSSLWILIADNCLIYLTRREKMFHNTLDVWVKSRQKARRGGPEERRQKFIRFMNVFKAFSAWQHVQVCGFCTPYKWMAFEYILSQLGSEHPHVSSLSQ